MPCRLQVSFESDAEQQALVHSGIVESDGGLAGDGEKQFQVILRELLEAVERGVLEMTPSSWIWRPPARQRHAHYDG